jgi:hypothetical protein
MLGSMLNNDSSMFLDCGQVHGTRLAYMFTLLHLGVADLKSDGRDVALNKLRLNRAVLPYIPYLGLVRVV